MAMAAPPGGPTAHPQYDPEFKGPNPGSFILSVSQQVDIECQLAPGSALSAENKTGVYTLAGGRDNELNKCTHDTEH